MDREVNDEWHVEFDNDEDEFGTLIQKITGGLPVTIIMRDDKDDVMAFDPKCGRFADAIPYIVDQAKMEDTSPDLWVKREEGTYNEENGHFLCDTCYIKAGTPSAPIPNRWVCP